MTSYRSLVFSTLRNIKYKYYIKSDYLLKFYNSFPVSNAIYPINEPEYHLELALTALQTFYSATDNTGFAAKYYLSNRTYDGLYVETTGYTLNTLQNLNQYLKHVNLPSDLLLHQDWINSATIKSIDAIFMSQLNDGSFPSGHSGMQNWGKPSLFNSGQVALGLVRCVKDGLIPTRFNELKALAKFFRNALRDDDLIQTYCFNAYYGSYYVRALWGAASLGFCLGDEELQNIAYTRAKSLALRQLKDGSIAEWGFKAFTPLHTIIYTMRGFLELAILYDDRSFLDTTANAINWLETSAIKLETDFGPITTSLSQDSNQKAQVCLTGLAQEFILLNKYQRIISKNNTVLFNTNGLKYLKSHQFPRGSALMTGGLPGSIPLNGMYQPMSIPQWGLKFFIDALLIELGIDIMKIDS